MAWLRVALGLARRPRFASGLRGSKGYDLEMVWVLQHCASCVNLMTSSILDRVSLINRVNYILSNRAVDIHYLKLKKERLGAKMVNSRVKRL